VILLELPVHGLPQEDTDILLRQNQNDPLLVVRDALNMAGVTGFQFLPPKYNYHKTTDGVVHVVGSLLKIVG
jgi:hypothetical protein